MSPNISSHVDSPTTKKEEVPTTEKEGDLVMSDIDDMATPPALGRENRQELFNLMHTLCSDPKGQGATQTVSKNLTEKGLGTLVSEGHTIIKKFIEPTVDNVIYDLQKWIHRLLDQTRDQTPMKMVTVSSHNLRPVGITLSIDVIEDTLALGPYITCLPNVLMHGQDTHSIKRVIGEFSSVYQILVLLINTLC